VTPKKEVTCASFFNITKRPIEVEERNAKAKAMETEEREIMLINMSNMTPKQRA
jgi:hypothetical protein